MGQWRRRSGRQRRWGEVSVGARVGVPLTGAALGGGGRLRCGAVRCGPAPRCRPVLVRCWVRSLVSREKPPRCSRGPCEGYASEDRARRLLETKERSCVEGQESRAVSVRCWCGSGHLSVSFRGGLRTERSGGGARGRVSWTLALPHQVGFHIWLFINVGIL